jgi:hypothetical protein
MPIFVGRPGLLQLSNVRVPKVHAADLERNHSVWPYMSTTALFNAHASARACIVSLKGPRKQFLETVGGRCNEQTMPRPSKLQD